MTTDPATGGVERRSPRGFAGIQKRHEAKRRQLLVEQESLRAALPLKYLYQTAQFTTPASNLDMIGKAVTNGLAATPKILAKLGISNAELADTLGVSVGEVEAVLAGDPRSPLVMVDGEDAQALRDDVVARGRANAVKAFRDLDWGRTLRFYRPSGLNLPYCVADLVTVLSGVGEGRAPEQFPIDGIIWPKVEHAREIAWVCQVLDDIERASGLERNRIRLQFLVESGWGLMNLAEITKECAHRLSGIIFGIADYSADITLPTIANDHPVCDWARMVVVNQAGTVDVPAIDNMTVNYPVADAKLSPEENRKRVLARLKECYDDAVHGMRLGMSGKWVGHPAQLAMVQLAYRSYLSQSQLDEELHKLEAYTQAVAAEQGATIIKGVMSDRATDRHARSLLRRAVAFDKLPPEKGLQLGVVNEAEVADLRARASGSASAS